METKHTPGPWEIGEDGPIRYALDIRPVWNIYGGEGLDGQLVGSVEHFPTDGFPNANARLIASAPNLLDVAQDALIFVRHWKADVEAGVKPLTSSLNDAEAMLVAAIAKATGQ